MRYQEKNKGENVLEKDESSNNSGGNCIDSDDVCFDHFLLSAES